MNRQYLSLKAYGGKLKLLFAAGVLKLGLPLKVVSTVDEHQIRFIATSFVEYFIRGKQAYTREPMTVNWIRELIEKDDVVYDVGANVGGFSLFMGKRVVKGSGVVYAFEPEASNFYSLNRNIVLNELDGKVLPYPIAFGDGHQIGRLYLSSTVPGSSFHSIEQRKGTNRKSRIQHIQGAVIFRLDDFVGQSGVKFPNHIKIDVDGSEKMVVQNMTYMLSDVRLKSVMIEIDEALSEGEIEKIFVGAGFKEASRERRVRKNEVNILFVRN